MSMFGGDNELGNILQEAVKIKSAQMGQKRKKYETWPYFVQHTIFHGEKEHYKAGRLLPFDEKIEYADKVKEEGNELFKKGAFADAVDKYEEAPTVLYYCYSTDPGWRKNNRGIDDDVIVLVDDQGTTPEEAEQHRRLRLTCCLNLAACKSKLAKYDEAVVACDTALELDPDNVKALYRRAEARVRPSKSTAYDTDMAIKDLANAERVDPTNKTVTSLLASLRKDRKVQRSKDSKNYAGMFERGQIYKEELEKELQKTTAVSSGSNEPDLQTLQERIDNISDEDSLEKRCADAELLRDLYMRNGKEDEAKELNEKIKVAKQALKERETGRSGLDWENPTEEMIQDAKKYDLDLTDPTVRSELKRLEEEGLGDNPGDADEIAERLATARLQEAEDSARKTGELPLPEADTFVPVPWMRYVILFGAVFLFFYALKEGVFRWFVGYVWRMVVSIFAGGADSHVDDADGEEKSSSGSIFARAYRKMFGGRTDGDHDELYGREL